MLGSVPRHERRFAAAETYCQRALTIDEQALGADDTETASAADGLAKLYLDEGRWHEAEPLAERVVGIFEKKFPAHDRATVGALLFLSGVKRELGNYSAANTLIDQAMELEKSGFGENDPIIADTLGFAAKMRRLSGQFDQALQLYGRALTMLASTPDAPIKLDTVSGMADVYYDQRNYIKARETYQQAVEIAEQVHGRDSIERANLLFELAKAQGQLADFVGAQASLDQSLPITHAVFGDSIKTAQILFTLAIVDDQLRDSAGADSSIQQAISLAQRQDEPKPNAGALLSDIAQYLSETGQFAKAESLSQQAITATEREYGRDNRIYAAVLHKIAVIYEAAGRPSAAINAAQEALDIERKVDPQDSAPVAAAMTELGRCLWQADRYAEALDQLKSAYGVAERQSDPQPLAEVANELGNVNLELGAYADAQALYEKAIAAEIRGAGGDSLKGAIYRTNLASALRSEARYADAEKAALQSVETEEKFRGPDNRSPDYSFALNKLGDTYYAEARYADAERALGRAYNLDRSVEAVSEGGVCGSAQ